MSGLPDRATSLPNWRKGKIRQTSKKPTAQHFIRAARLRRLLRRFHEARSDRRSLLQPISTQRVAGFRAAPGGNLGQAAQQRPDRIRLLAVFLAAGAAFSASRKCLTDRGQSSLAYRAASCRHLRLSGLRPVIPDAIATARKKAPPCWAGQGYGGKQDYRTGNTPGSMTIAPRVSE